MVGRNSDQAYGRAPASTTSPRMGLYLHIMLHAQAEDSAHRLDFMFTDRALWTIPTAPPRAFTSERIRDRELRSMIIDASSEKLLWITDINWPSKQVGSRHKSRNLDANNRRAAGRITATGPWGSHSSGRPVAVTRRPHPLTETIDREGLSNTLTWAFIEGWSDDLGKLWPPSDQRGFQCDRQYSTSVCQNTISDRKAASISVANII